MKNLFKKIIIASICGLSFAHADSFLYVTSYSSNTISTYKILADGSLHDENKVYKLSGIPEDLGTYNQPGNPNKFIFLAYSNINKIAVWRANPNGDLNLVGEYSTSKFPDPISSVLNDKYLYVNSAQQLVSDGFNFDSQTGQLSPLKGFPYKISNATYGYMFSPNGKFIYEQYINTNKFAAIPINEDGSWGQEPTNKVATGISPGHYTIYNGYLYVLNLASNGISKYKLTEDQGGFIPSNSLSNNVNMDYKFNFVPLRMMRLDNHLYVTDTSNRVNVFSIDKDNNIRPEQQINCGGVLGRSLRFEYPGFAYQPILDSNKIAQYIVSADGKLSLLHTFNAPIKPFHIAIFNY